MDHHHAGRIQAARCGFFYHQGVGTGRIDKYLQQGGVAIDLSVHGRPRVGNSSTGCGTTAIELYFCGDTGKRSWWINEYIYIIGTAIHGHRRLISTAILGIGYQ